MKHILLITKSIALIRTALKTKRVKLSLKTGLVRENFCGKGWALRQVFNTSMTWINVEMKGQSK